MKIQFEVKKKTIIFLLFLSIIALLALLIVKFRPPVFLTFARDAARHLKILSVGKDAYVTKALIDQAHPNETGQPTLPTIETSRLPLRQRYVPLPKDFPAAGGALTTINGKLLVMSRTGQFFKFEAEEFKSLNFKKIPNNLSEYILHSKEGLSSDALRASSVAYDDKDHRIYVGYTKYIDSKTNRLALSSMALDPNTLEMQGDWRLEFESNDVAANYLSQAGGGKVLVNRGNLYFSVGYGDAPTEVNGKRVPASQNENSKLGKIFRLNLATREFKLVSMGHRNVQGMTVTQTGQLLSTEHGPQGGDEINMVKDGSNFGWPYRTYGTDYGSYNYNSGWEIPVGFASVEPMFAFVPSIAISPILAIEGFHSAWDGNILAGSLKAQSLFRLVVVDGRVVVSEPIWIGHRIRDIAHVPSGEIVLLTDDSLLVLLTVDEAKLKGDSKNAGYNFEPKLQRCLVCHHFEQSTPSSMAPSLANVVGRKLGADSFLRYSNAFKSQSGVWTEERLAKFIANPQSVVPGTIMPNLGISEGEAEDIAKILAK